jgi:hypothetical protein
VLVPLAAREISTTARVRRTRWACALAIIFTLAMFGAMLAVRWRLEFSNVDDYLYALQTRAYVNALGLSPVPLIHTWAAYGTYSPLVPMLALPIGAINDSPNTLVLIQGVFLATVFVSLRSLLGSLGFRPVVAWLAAALITTLPPVLGYSVMYHYGLAATACTTGAAAAYARSERLHRRGPTALLGVAIGLLSIARVLAPVYVAALVVTIAIDVWADNPNDRAAQLRHAGLAAMIAVVIAAPWWLTAGVTAIDYLTSAGYGLAGPSHLDAAGHRFIWTATETGWLLSAVLVALLAWALRCALLRAAEWRLAAWLLGTVTLGMALLATSANSGTGFALPFVVLGCAAAAWGVERIATSMRIVVRAAVIVSLLLPALALLDLIGPAEVGGRPLWQVGTPGLSQAQLALGCRCAPPDSDALARRVVRVVGDDPVFIARSDALLNPQSLRFEAANEGHIVDLIPPAADGTVTRAQLSQVRFVLAGATPLPYGGANGFQLLNELNGFRVTPVLEIGLSPVNSVQLLRISPKPS